MVTRLLLDTSSLMYRAFYAVPTSIAATDGAPVNAVRGYLDMTSRVANDRGVEEIVHVLDDEWRPEPRVAAYPDYKAHRAPEPVELGPQFELLGRLLSALGQAQVTAPGWEADDAIATLVAAATDQDRVAIVTGDRDLIQLVTDGGDGYPSVTVLFTVRGTSRLHAFDEAAVAEAYGVPPARYVDYAILRGDPSDGLPGISGVGEKTARRLVEEYASLDELLADADAHPPRLAEKLRDAGDYVAAMRSVVPVRGDCELSTRRGGGDDDAVRQLATAWNLAGPVERFEALGSD
jgi:5'-3' exonuclease